LLFSDYCLISKVFVIKGKTFPGLVNTISREKNVTNKLITVTNKDLGKRGYQSAFKSVLMKIDKLNPFIVSFYLKYLFLSFVFVVIV
jgi:hypothetical protein